MWSAFKYQNVSMRRNEPNGGNWSRFEVQHQIRKSNRRRLDRLKEMEPHLIFIQRERGWMTQTIAELTDDGFGHFLLIVVASSSTDSEVKRARIYRDGIIPRTSEIEWTEPYWLSDCRPFQCGTRCSPEDAECDWLQIVIEMVVWL